MISARRSSVLPRGRFEQRGISGMSVHSAAAYFGLRSGSARGRVRVQNLFGDPLNSGWGDPGSLLDRQRMIGRFVQGQHGGQQGFELQV